MSAISDMYKVFLTMFPVLFPLTITVTEMSVNGNTSIQLTLTIIVTEIHAKTVT